MIKDMFKIRCLTLSLNGLSNGEIARVTGKPSQVVSAVLIEPEILELRQKYMTNMADTFVQVGQMIQMIAPVALHTKLDAMLNAHDPKLREKAATDFLNMAGHKPTEHIEIRDTSHEAERYKKMSDLELKREMLMNVKDDPADDVDDDPQTVH